MDKQTSKRSADKLAGVPPQELAPLKDVAGDTAAVEDWISLFQALPLEGKNKALRENPELLEVLGAVKIREGDMLIGPLAAESSHDRAEGEHTFLIILKPLRDRLIREYGIRTGAEYMLLDALVLSYYQYIRAASALFSYTGCDSTCNYETLVRYAQPYLTRANEMLLRNLEALRQMKEAPFVLKIKQAAQVNVGEKQVNVAGEVGPGGAGSHKALAPGRTIALPELSVQPEEREAPGE